MIKTWRLLGPLVPKKIFLRKLILTTPPPPQLPPPPEYQNFSNHHTNFPDITKFPTKLTQFLTKFTEFVPFFFARLALFAQQTGRAGANPCIKDHFNGIREIFKTNRETWRSARKPGDSRVNRETWQLCVKRDETYSSTVPNISPCIGIWLM